MIEKSYTYQEVKFKMEQWCAYQDRCSFEVQEKIKSFFLSDDQTIKLIEELRENRFLDDVRFVESFVSGKFRIKNWGKIKIKHHLIQKRIPKELIYNGLDLISSDDYSQTITKLLHKKEKELKRGLGDYEKKSKLFLYLTSKGFEFEEIQKCHDLLKNNLF